MNKIRTHSSLNWLRLLLSGGSDKNPKRMISVGPMLFRAMVTICAGLVVCLGWYFEDRKESYRVGYPSPRTYLAQSSTRFVDKNATTEVRGQAADQIVNVRVRDDRATQAVSKRISGLKNNGDIEFASPQLISVLDSMSDDQREKIIAATIDIAEKNYDKAINKPEQTAMIWDSLRFVDMPQSDKNVVFQLLDSMLEPTIQEDAEMTNRLRNEVSSQIPSVLREIRIGGLLVEKGKMVTPAIAEILREQGYPDAAVPWKNLAFIVIISFFWSLWITWLGTKQETQLTDKEWIFVAVVLAIDWVAQKWFARLDIDALSILATVGWLFLTLSPAFAFHVALGGCLIGYLLAFPSMTSQIAVGCVICGVASGASFLLVREASSRIMIWRNIFSLGVWLTFASLFIRWGFGLAITWEMAGIYLVLNAFWSSLVVAVLPLWETVFGMISPLRLLEMSHPSQPLLKRLQLEAPGTYHHTVSVATLAEAVADKLGMNGLLVKTGAFYHDIGKLKRPHYFVENQSFGDNIHDRLAPQESAKMILGHVEDGLKLADEYKIPEAIKDFIREHHGKTCLTYFYQKAVNADKEAGGDGSSVDKSAYCYPGPNPRHPETALLMLADSIEAALKGLKSPLSSRAEIDKLVGDVIDSKVMSGQFVDVDFTLKDLNAIRNAFVEVLMSMYHTREVKPLDKDGEEQADPNPPRPSRPKP